MKKSLSILLIILWGGGSLFSNQTILLSGIIHNC